MKTILYEEHLKLNAKMILYAGYQMPVSYTSITDEHLGVRNNAGIFDVSHMGEILITGSDTLKFVNHLLTNTITTEENKVTYALLLNEDGYCIDDLLCYMMNPQKVLLVVNASNKDKDFTWIKEKATSFNVNVTNISNLYSQIALQGPNVKTIIQKILGFDPTDLNFMTYRIYPFDLDEIIVSRTGYTGEDGFEIYAKDDSIIKIWQKAISLGVKPIGLGARDTLRFEASLPLYGHEISDSINPYQAQLGFAVKLDKDFIGKEKLILHKQNLDKKLVGVELVEKGIPRSDYLVYSENNQVIGKITTGYLLPNHEFGLALALIDVNHAKMGTSIYVEIRNHQIKAVVRDRKFKLKNYQK